MYGMYGLVAKGCMVVAMVVGLIMLIVSGLIGLIAILSL